MRKFKDLEFEDQLQFYRWFFQNPMFVILIFLILYEINYVVICYLFTTTIIGDLIFFGILDDQKGYGYVDLILDACCLFIVTFFATSLAAPALISFISNINLLPATNILINYTATVISILVLFLLWYSTIRIQRRINPNIGTWKWKLSGLFNSTKRLKAR